MQQKASMSDLDMSTHAPAPHALAADREISNGAFRAWNIIHLLKWNHIEPSPDAIAHLTGAGRRSVFRWLEELQRERWLTWNKNHPDPRKRYLLRTCPSALESITLEKISALIASGEATIEDIARLVRSATSGTNHARVPSMAQTTARVPPVAPVP